ncbi:hypothetical protein L3Q82_007369 [Scortum barcoo]|uniref:Uncharacterized protein n=1 Tax=Scortum barcoo TaxID=214431 RepID=A0ACB8WU71_9TELE|nr:hypothetical protein L3Q82_007369 [Scortum barcoo]
MSLGWPGNASGSPRKSWRKCLGTDYPATFAKPQIAHIKCKVPADFTSPVALFEVNHPDLNLEQLDLGDGLVEVHQTSHHTQQSITLNNFTVLGSIQPIDKIVDTDQTDSVEANDVDSSASVRGENKDHTEQPSQLWHPPVD